MKRNLLVTICILLAVTLCGCKEDTNMAVVGTGNDAIDMFNTDDPTEYKSIKNIVDDPNQVMMSPDNKLAYVTSDDDNKIIVVDLQTQKIKNTIELKGNFFAINGIWDMDLSGDGSTLAVGYDEDKVALINTTTNAIETTVDIDQGSDDFPYGQKLAINYYGDALYTLEVDKFLGIPSSDPDLESYSAANNWKRLDKIEITDFGFWDHITSIAIKDHVEYEMAVSPHDDVLIAMSSKIYACTINENGSLNNVYPDGLDATSDENDAVLGGNSRILFTRQDKIYITSAGIHLNAFDTEANLGGGSVCLDKQAILDGAENPFIADLDNFLNDVLPWIVGKLGLDNAVVNYIVDNLSFFGISASCVGGNTVYMVISPVVTLTKEDTGLPIDITPMLAIFENILNDFDLWVGGTMLGNYASSIAVNPAEDTLLLADDDSNVVEIIKRQPVIGWNFLNPAASVEVDGKAQAMAAACVPEVEKK